MCHDFDEPAGGKVVGHRDTQKLRDAGAVQGRDAHRLPRVGVEDPLGQEAGAIGEADRIGLRAQAVANVGGGAQFLSSEAPTSELQSLMRLSYAVLGLKKTTP